MVDKSLSEHYGTGDHDYYISFKQVLEENRTETQGKVVNWGKVNFDLRQDLSKGNGEKLIVDRRTSYK